jgi:hypothetical protein
MADEEQSGNEMVTSKDDVWMMDVDTFVPKPDGYVKIKGVKYPIFSFLDVLIDDSMKVSRLGDDIRLAGDYAERMERSIEQIILLNAPAEKQGLPTLTRDVFAAKGKERGISPRQILMLTILASSIAKVPLKAAGSQESAADASPSPSPAAADSTGGENRATTSE